MNIYRIDIAHGRTSTRFWLDARNIVSAVVRGAYIGLRDFRRLTHKSVLSFTVTREIA